MTENEAINEIYMLCCNEPQYYPKGERKCKDNCMYGENFCAFQMAIRALEDVQEYRKIGTVEELKKSVKEENVLKFYYCESEDDYYIGKYMGNMYYAKYGEAGFVWFMSRYLPWGEHVVAPHTLWKEYTYPSEPKEIPFDKWIQGFLKKYCGGSQEECREAVEKTKPKKILNRGKTNRCSCPSCNMFLGWSYSEKYCKYCGQRLEEE